MPRTFVSAVTQKSNAWLAGDSQQEREQQAKRATVFDFDDREDDEEDAQGQESTTDDSDNGDADRHDQSSPDLLRPGNVGIHPSCCLSSQKLRPGGVIVKSRSIDSGDISNLSADKKTDAGSRGLLKRDSRAVTIYVDEKATREEDGHPSRGKRPRSNDDAEVPRPSSLRDDDNALACLKESEIDAPLKHRAAANAADGDNDGAGGSEISMQEAREQKTQAERGQEVGNGSDVVENGYFTVVFATQKLGLTIAQDDSGSVVVCDKEEIVVPAEIAAGRDRVSIGDRVVAIGSTRVAGLDMTDMKRMLVRGPRPLEVEFHRTHQSSNKVRSNESAAKHHVGAVKPASPWRQPLGGLERPSRDCLLDAISNIATQEDSLAEAQLFNGGQESQHEGAGAEVEAAARNKVCVASSGSPSPGGGRAVERKHEDRIPSKDLRTNSLPQTVVCINGVGPPKEAHHHGPNSTRTTSSSRASGGVAGAQRAQDHSQEEGPHREATENVLPLPPHVEGTGAAARKKGEALRVAEHSAKGGENGSARGGGGYVGEIQPAQHQSHDNGLRRESTETLVPLPPHVGETGAVARQKGEALRLVEHSAKGGGNGSARSGDGGGGGGYVGEMQHAQHQSHEDGLRKEATKTSLRLPPYVGETGAVARQKGEVLRLVEHSAKGGEDGSARSEDGYVGETQRAQHRSHEDGLHHEATETPLPLPSYVGETVAVARQRGAALRVVEHSAKGGENGSARGGGGYVGGIQRAQHRSHEDGLHREATETLFPLPRYAGETGSIARQRGAAFRINEPSAKGGENGSTRGGGYYVGGIQRAQQRSHEDGLHREATQSLFPLPPYNGETGAVAKQKGATLRLVESSAKGGENGSARGGCVSGGIQRAQHQSQEGLFPLSPYAGETDAVARQKGAALRVVEPSAKGGENGSARGGGNEGGYRKRSKVKKPAGTSAPAATLPKMIFNGGVSSSNGAGAGPYGNDRKAQTAIPDMAEVTHILTKLGSRGVSELTLYKSLTFEELVRISRYAGVDVSKRLSKATMAERLNTLYVEKGILRREHFIAVTGQLGDVQRSGHSRNDVAGHNRLDALYHTQTSSDAAGKLAIPVQNVSCARPLPRPFPPPQPLLPHPYEARTSSPRSCSAWHTSTAAAALDGGQVLTPQPSRATWPLSPSMREGSPVFVVRPGCNGNRNLPASSPPLSAPTPTTRRRTGGVKEDYQQCWEDWDYRQHMAGNRDKRYDEGNGASPLFAARTGYNGSRNLPASSPPLSTPTPATPRRTWGAREDSEQCWEDWDYCQHMAVDRHKRYDEGSEASWWRGESDGYWTACPSPPSVPRSPMQDYRGRGMREMHAPRWRNPLLPSVDSMRSTQARELPDETTFAVLPRWTLRSVRTIGTQV